MVDLNEINELNYDNIGTASTWIKVAIIILACAAVMGAGYYFFIRDQIEALDDVVREEEGLRATLIDKQRRASNLDAYKAQLAEMERAFGTLLRQLPSATEIDNLLVDVSQTALASGLEINLFEPRAEAQRDFYAELPIQLRLEGSYHELGNFVSGVAALPRIVTVHDIQMSVGSEVTGGTSQLSVTATAKTYRYLDEE